MLKRLVNQKKKTFSSFGKQKFLKKLGSIKVIEQKRVTGNILQKRKVLGRWESPQFMLRTILVIIFHRLHQQHSERLSSQSSKTKVISISILKVCLLNPCLKLINVLIWIAMKWIPQIPVNTTKCTQKSLQERSLPSWIRTNLQLMVSIR